MSEEKTESNSVGSMLKLGVILALYAVVSCTLLAVVNNFTAPVIKQNLINKANEGMKAVFADAESFEQVTDFTPSTDASITIDNLYLAKKAGAVVGAVVQVTGPTYDHSTILIGLDMTQTVTGMVVLETSDSRGFGQKSKEPTFYGQFAGKKVSDGFVAGQTFDAISGATITSKGIATLLSMGTYVAGKYLADNCGATAATGSAPVVEKGQLFTFEEAVADINGQYKEFDGLTAANASDVTPQGTLIVTDSSKANQMVVNKLYLIKNGDGKAVEAAAVISGQTYGDNGGTIVVLVNTRRVITGVRVVALDDSPNMGQNATKPSFYNQFAGKSVDQDFRNGTDFDAVSGASITSDCIADMVKAASYTAAAILADNGGDKAPAGSENYTLNNHFREE
jgi:electron transport complex protein RnfG